MKPILFNTEMVRAILEGRKTVTRRVVKPQSKNACGFYVTTRMSDGAFMGVYDFDENGRMVENSQTPPACIGDVLYVRETWSEHYTADSDGKLVYCYKADNVNLKSECLPGENNRWYPSIHMPKEAARIFLKVIDVRVEHLQDITLEECHKEGINIATDVVTDGETINAHHDFSMERFETLWDSTIKKDQLSTYGWDANPYVWVIEFESITKDQALAEMQKGK